MSDDFERTPDGAVLMDGNRLRDETVTRLRAELDALGSPAVCLATVLVGGDRPSQIYVRMKHRKAEEAGLVSQGVELPDTASQAEVEAAVQALVDDPAVHGILVQLPLPDHLDPEPVLALLPPAKDVDGLTERSMGRLVRGSARPRAVHPARRDAAAWIGTASRSPASARSSSGARPSSAFLRCSCSAARAWTQRSPSPTRGRRT